MGAGASAEKYKAIDEVKGAAVGDITGKVQGCSAADKAMLRAAVEARLAGAEIMTNFQATSTNEATLHDLHVTVMTNKEGVYEARSMIEENRMLILKNYASAFVGNRQMANQNTDDLFKNRTAIFDALPVAGQVVSNFRNSKYNESAIDFLENRSLLNNRVAKVNLLMSEANADFIAINKQIMEGNEEIVQFNAAQITTNTNLLAGVKDEKATPEANAARIASNKEKIEKIKAKNVTYNEGMGEKHKLIIENRKHIEENAAKIKARRELIMANREIIKKNAGLVADKLRANCQGVEELMAKLKDLSDDEVKAMQAGLVEADAGEAVETNRKKISENEAKLHTLHLQVTGNKTDLYHIRAVIEENRAVILKNYAAAFMGNRQMANTNTDDIFKNRTAILDAIKVEGQVQENWRNSKYNEATADFLEHRSKMNNRVAKVNELLSKANAKLIDINDKIMASNEEIVTFNSAQIETNGKLLAGIQADKATPEANAERIAKNSERIKVIEDRVAKYDENCRQMLEKVAENANQILENAKDIEARREKIKANRDNLSANGEKVAAMLKA